MKITPWDGTAISTPGVFSNVPMSVYHGRMVAAPEHSASRSVLWKMVDKSPAHAFLSHYSNPDRDEDGPTESEALLLGRGAHHLILGEADFSAYFVFHPETYPEGAVYPSMIGAEKPWSGNAKWCKAWIGDHQIKSLEVLKPRHMEAIRGMAGGLYANPLVRAGILNGFIETTLVAKDPKTGIWLKIRPDAMPTDDGTFSDLKTAADISDEGLEKAIGDTGIFLQGAMTRRICRMLDIPFESFSPVFVEKTAPFCARVKTLTDADLDLGETVLDMALAAYARCIERNVWLGPGGDQTDAEYAQMTPWKRGQIERRLIQLQKELSL